MSEKRWLTLILILFVLLGCTYALITPVFEASDELWHYPLVRHLADGNPLPIQVFDPDQAGPWKQEASQPPLYYYFGAALTFWIDTSDMADVRIENPHVDNGLITEDGNINLVMHDPDANPWQGTLLAVRIVRLFSVLLGAATVTLTYLIAKQTIPGRPEIALAAAAVNAFLPMFVFISGAVNNDNLAITLASLALFVMIRVILKEQRLTADAASITVRRQYAWQETAYWLLLGVIIGAGLLTKQGTIGLLPLAWGTTFVFAWQRDRRTSKMQDEGFAQTSLWLARLFGRSLVSFALIMLPVLLIAGWWYWRNIQLYGDLLGWNAFIAVLGERAQPASLAQLWGERRGFLMSYWGLFGGVNVPMPNWVYTVLNILLLFSLLGFVIYFIRLLRQWALQVKSSWRGLRSWIENLFIFVTDNFGLVICILFAAAVIVGLIRWATTTWSSQGRLVFTALSALSILFMVGLLGWMPGRPARWSAALISTFLFMIAALAPFLWIAPAYDPDSYTPPHIYVLHPQNTNFGEKMRLRSVAVETETPGQSAVQPGDSLWVHLEWELLQKVGQDWSVFVHLVDPILGQPIAQRDMYPGQGLTLTSWMEPGQKVINSYRLQVPPTAIAPAQLDIAAGLYDFNTGERLATINGRDLAYLAKVLVEPSSGEFPNPVNLNFEDELVINGYEIEPRRSLPGETIDLTIYWQAAKQLTEDYTFFAQVVGADTTRWASYDLAPSQVTSSWNPREVYPFTFTLDLDENTPPGLYPVIVGAYTRSSNGEFNRLQIVTPDNRLAEDFVELTRIRVE